ncbi:MAG: GTP-binding protein [Candidatus Kariarchaeaceae archaeon]
MSGKFILKMSLLGDGAVGKTSLRKRFMGQGYRDEHLQTIGADFAAKHTEMEYNGKQRTVTFQIWDLAGQQRFESIRSRFFQGSMGGLCIFDITREDSFKNIPRWIEELWKHNGKGVVPIVLIGNKSDLRDRSSVSEKRAKEYCQEMTKRTSQYGFDVVYIETSAKTGLNIEQAFESMGRKIIDKYYKR